MARRKGGQSRFSWLKLLVNLLVVASLVGIGIAGYLAFSHQLNPIIGAASFIAITGISIWLISVLRKSTLHYRKPSFALVFWSLLGITLVCAFAGIEPLSSYKDGLFSSISSQIQNIPNSTRSDNATSVSQLAPSSSIPPQTTPTSIPPVANTEITYDIHDIEKVAFALINSERVKAGLPETLWDDKLYGLSLNHTQQMAEQRQLFHSPMNGLIGEDAWGGYGYSQYNGTVLGQIIVDSWLSSPLHKAWLLHASLKHSVVSIVSDSNGQYASWTFWTSEAGAGPPLMQKAYKLWQFETGGKTPWLTWLDMKGYPNNQEFLRQLGEK